MIGEECLFSYRVSIIDHDHEFIKGNSPVSSEIGQKKAIHIGNRTFVGANTTVLKGTRIGNDCIIGANSLVSGEFPDNTIVGGVPARIIRHR
jgi:acetyltransferase-like isoleucine patch superfamily enzyme